MSVDDAEQSASEGAERGLDLSSLLQGALGEGGTQGSGSEGLAGLGGLLGGLLGQGAPEGGPADQPALDDAGLVESAGISPSIAQAAMALVMGSLLRGSSAEGSEGGGLTSLLGQLGDKPLDQEAVKATGLPQQLSSSTGLDLPKAVQTVQQILEMLRKVTKPLGSAGASTTAPKKRRRRSDSSAPKPKAKSKAKPKAATKPKAKAKPKAKPKKTTSSTRPKTKPKKTSASSTTKRRRSTS